MNSSGSITNYEWHSYYLRGWMCERGYLFHGEVQYADGEGDEKQGQPKHSLRNNNITNND
jgi:hypothetical protein